MEYAKAQPTQAFGALDERHRFNPGFPVPAEQTAGRPPGIPAALDDLTRQLADAEDALNNLLPRLAPVTRVEPAKNGAATPNGHQGRDPSCQLAGLIAESAAKAGLIAETIRLVTSRLEL